MRTVILLLLVGCASPTPAPTTPDHAQARQRLVDSVNALRAPDPDPPRFVEPPPVPPSGPSKEALWCASDAEERKERREARKADYERAMREAKHLLEWRNTHCQVGEYNGGKLDGQILWICPPNSPRELRPGSEWREPKLETGSNEETWKNEHCLDSVTLAH